MRYTLNTENYHNFETIQDGVLPPRSYFIPFGSKERMAGIGAVEKRYRSDKVKVLNGEWDFLFFRDPNELPEVFDTDAVRFGRIPVPSCWKFTGVMNPFYVNLR